MQGSEKIVNTLDAHIGISTRDAIKIILLSILFVASSFFLQGNIDLNPADEGYLWYGAWRTSLGEIPIRDFQSYDPGRYYWSAAFLKLLGNGIISLRISLAVFQAIGLTFGLLILKRFISRQWILVSSGMLLLVWMYPSYKIFEPVISLVALYFAVLLIEKPNLRQHFIAGVFVGIAAFFGRNHGLYNFIGFLALIIFLFFKIERSDFFKKIAVWISGILLGYSPMIFMLIFVPGFFDSFINSITFLFRFGATNYPLPVPWPWVPQKGSFSTSSVFTGMFFLILPVFYMLSMIYLLFTRNATQKKSLFVAATFIGIPYMHYAFSRAGIVHLALSIQPLLIGMMSLHFVLHSKYKKLITLFVISIFIMSFFSIANLSFSSSKIMKKRMEKLNIAGDGIWVKEKTANLIKAVKQINDKHVKHDEGILLAPNLPTLYPIIGQSSPLWDIYFLFKETGERQKEMISELKKKDVNWIVLGDIPIDGRNELRFRNTHNLVWQHFKECFEPVEFEGLSSEYQLLHRKRC